jgi:competence protein ComEA
MEWLRTRITEALAGSRPVSRKLLLALGLLVASVVFVVGNLTSPSTGQQTLPNSAPSSELVAAGVEDSAQAISAAVIFVHIIGAVESPGIYELDAGSRVIDAVFAAGGLTSSADQASINLARSLSDGEQIFIGVTGQAMNSGGVQGPQSNLINLNLATVVELEGLPGVGPALAGRLVDWRQANGGFKKKEDLLEVSGIGDKLYSGIKDLVSL